MTSSFLFEDIVTFLDDLRRIGSSATRTRALLENLAPGINIDDPTLTRTQKWLTDLFGEGEPSTDTTMRFLAWLSGVNDKLTTGPSDIADVNGTDIGSKLLSWSIPAFARAKYPNLYNLLTMLTVIKPPEDGSPWPVLDRERLLRLLNLSSNGAFSVFLKEGYGDTWAGAAAPVFSNLATMVSELGVDPLFNFNSADNVCTLFFSPSHDIGVTLALSDTLGLMVAPFGFTSSSSSITTGDWKWGFALKPHELIDKAAFAYKPGQLTLPDGVENISAVVTVRPLIPSKRAFISIGSKEDDGTYLEVRDLSVEARIERHLLNGPVTIILAIKLGGGELRLSQGVWLTWTQLTYELDFESMSSVLRVDGLVISGLGNFFGFTNSAQEIRLGRISTDNLEIETQADGSREFIVQLPPELIRDALARFGLDATADGPGFTVILTIQKDWAGAEVQVTGSLNKIGLNLGSPLARLTVEPAEGESPLAFSLNTADGFGLTLPSKVKGNLDLDIFSTFGIDGPIVNNIFSSDKTDPTKSLISIKFDETGEPGQLAAAGVDPADFRKLLWVNGYPQASIELIKGWIEDSSAAVTEGKQLLSLSGELPAGGGQMTTTFTTVDGGVTVGDEENANAFYPLKLPVGLEINQGDEAILTGNGTFQLCIPAEGDDQVRFEPGAFKLAGSGDFTLKTTGSYTFGGEGNGLISLQVPENSSFVFDCNPDSPELRWNTTVENQTPITIRMPANAQENGQFIFAMEQFRIHPAGIDLRGAIQATSVSLFGSGFDGPVTSHTVKRDGNGSSGRDRQHQIGEIELKNSQLIYGSMRATARLPYFDDAYGTLTLYLSQNEDGKLSCAGTLDITGIEEFHLDSLYSKVQVDVLHLGIEYTAETWKAEAAMTGRVQFAPPGGRSAGDMGILSELFTGLTIEFEDLNPLAAGDAKWRLISPPRRFTLADILFVDLRGLDFTLAGGTGDRGGSIKNLKLLGDLTIQQLPGVDASLSFGGITLTPNLPPKFKVDRIGADFRMPGGFSLAGEMEHLDDENEVGFQGNFILKMEALPELGGMLKLTRIRTLEDGTLVPSMALFVEREMDFHLMYNFYLRRLGLGFGFRQALRGLEPVKKATLDDRLSRFVDNPAGLPDPIFPGSWKPVVPKKKSDKLTWMLVGAGLITYGNKDADTAHLIAGSLMLSIDQDLHIVLASNLWLFTSPNETRDAEFIQRPVARGAIELSVREGYLRAYAKTIKGPKLGESAPSLLREVLNAVETSLRFELDRNGFLMEVGWPWETRISYENGKYLKGVLRSGYRFGIYRGVMTFGLNFGIEIFLEAEARWGFGAMGVSAAASLSATGHAEFEASFIGALSPQFGGYLLGDVRLDAQLTLRATASWEIGFKIKIFGKTKRFYKRFSFSQTIGISIYAALTAAMEANGNLGFRGRAEVAVSICGYHLSGALSFAFNDGVIDTVRERLNALMPPPLNGQVRAAGLSAAAESVVEVDVKPATWIYRYRWLEGKDGSARLRILLFPAPGEYYPIPSESDVEKRFMLPLKLPDLWSGFVGGIEAPLIQDSVLEWSEELDESIWNPAEDGYRQALTSSLAELQKDLALAPAKAAVQARITEINEELAHLDAKHYKLKDLLNKLERPPDVAILNLKKCIKDFSDSQLVNTAEIAQRKLDLDSAAAEAKGPIQAKIDELEGKNKQLQIQIDNFEKQVQRLNQGAQIAGNEITNEQSAAFEHEATQAFDNAPFQDDEAEGFFDTGDFCETGESVATGLLFGELLRLLKDESAQVGEDVNGGRLEEERYLAAHLMNLVLEFNVDKDQANDLQKKLDPIPTILDLDSRDIILGGTEAVLKSVWGDDAQLVEYDFIPGLHEQRAGQVCLAWEFRREEENVLEAVEDPYRIKVYPELEEFVVTRINRSQPHERPRVVTMQPAWLVNRPEDASEKPNFIRPRFQFVDDQMQNVSEGDLLQYRVEARAPERILATSLINVVRRTVEPLPPELQPLILHVVKKPEPGPSAYDQGLLLVVPCDIKFENEAPDEEIKNWLSELKFRYRLVAPQQHGSYGYDQMPSVRMSWKDGLPARKDDPAFPDIKFAESAQGEPLPWNDTEVWDLDLSSVTVTWLFDPLDTETEPEKKRRIGFYLEIDWPNPGDPRGQGLASGKALEVYLGRVRVDKEGKQPEQRSPLVKFRQAITAQAPEPESWIKDDGTLDLGRGNTVDAFELLTSPEVREFIDPSNLELTVAYPGYPQDVPAGNPENPTVIVRWRHDLGKAATNGVGSLEPDPFNPVVGYRIHRLDLYDPREYPTKLEDGEGMRPNTAAVVQAVPEKLYRARPDTILVEKVPVKIRGRKETSDDGAVEESAYEGNWKPVEELEPVGTGAQAPLGEAWGVFPNETIQWDAGVVRLRGELAEVLKELVENANTVESCRLGLVEPLEIQLGSETMQLGTEWGAAVADERTRIGDEINGLVAAELNLSSEGEAAKGYFDEENDPYGWLTAEKLGLSCECHFLDHDDKPVPADVIYKALEEIALPAEFHACFFVASDERTLLNVVRFVFIPGQEDLEPIIKQALTLRFFVGDARSIGQTEIDSILSTKPTVHQDYEKALALALSKRLPLAGITPGQTGSLRFRHDLRSQLAAENGTLPPAIPTAGIELPVNEEGVIEYHLPVPNQLAHRYKIAIEKVRRHDRAWRMIDADAKQKIDAESVPARWCKEVQIDRIKYLVKHNMVATPLAGSIQAIIFRHPAAFAAAASAVNAAHGQYSGQSVILERQIAELEGLKKHYIPDVESAVDWVQYEAHPDEAHPDNGESAENPLRFPDSDDVMSVNGPFAPVAGTELGVYGADRYIYPDMPAYYEYRVAVYSTAGRVRSPVKASSWISPLYDRSVAEYKARQQPKAMKPSAAIYDDAARTLTFRLPVVHARHHMMPELRDLWREADELVLGHRFGDLPDLYLTYQIYLQTNPDPNVNPGSIIAVYVPLLRLLGPGHEVHEDDDRKAVLGFSFEPQAPGINREKVAFRIDQPLTRIYFEITLTLDDLQCQPLVAALQATGGVETKTPTLNSLAVAVQKRGVWSQLAVNG